MHVIVRRAPLRVTHAHSKKWIHNSSRQYARSTCLPVSQFSGDVMLSNASYQSNWKWKIRREESLSGQRLTWLWHKYSVNRFFTYEYVESASRNSDYLSVRNIDIASNWNGVNVGRHLMIMIFRARIMNEIHWLRFILFFSFSVLAHLFRLNFLPFFWWSSTFWAIKGHRDRFENPQIISEWITILFVSVTAYAAFHQTTAQRDTNGCNVLCEVEIKPICAINDKGETKWFPSKCIMESENCVNKSSKAIQRSTQIDEPILISISLQNSRQYPTVRVLHFSCLRTIGSVTPTPMLIPW